MGILAFWREGIIALLIAVAGLLWLNGKAESARAAKWQTRSIETQAAFDQTVANYRGATELAKAQDAAHAARVERDQNVVSLETLDAYRKELDALKLRYANLRVRAGEAGTNKGNIGKSRMPEVSNPSGGSNQGAVADFACEANDLQLRALIAWVVGQWHLNKEMESDKNGS